MPLCGTSRRRYDLSAPFRPKIYQNDEDFCLHIIAVRTWLAPVSRGRERALRTFDKFAN